MTTRNRPQLKAFYVKNAIPTEGNFADLIDSSLNQSEDGIFKSSNDSLALVAAGDSKRVLRLFAAPPPAAADWQLSLNPPLTAATPQSSRAGLGVSNGAGALRLFIDATSGNLGVGTNNPGAPLDVRVPGVASSDRLLVDATTTWDGANKHVTLSANAGQLNLHNPHVPWLAGESRASLRFGRSGGVISGNFWDVGTRASGDFSVALNGATDAKLVITAAGVLSAGPTAVASLTSSGPITAPGATINGNLGITGAASAASLSLSGNLAAGSGAISNSLSAGSLTVGTVSATSLNTTTLTATGNLSAGSLTTAGSATTAQLTAPIANLGAPSRFGVSVTRSNQKVALPMLPASLAVSTGLVLQAWVYFYVFEDGPRIIELGNAGNSLDTISLFANASAQLCCQYSVNGVASGVFSSAGGALKPNTWQFVAASISDTGAVRLYINNAQVASAQHQPLRNVQRAENVLCESISGSPMVLSGAVGEVALWVGPVATPTSAPLVGNEAKLVGLWRLNGSAVNACQNAPGLGAVTLSFQGESVLPTFVLLHEKTQQLVIAGENWTPLALPPNWFAINPLAYFKDALGMVHLRGSMILNNSPPGLTSAVLPTVLPVGYRPQTTESHPIVLHDTIGRIDITPEGTIGVKLGHTWLTCLDGVHFRAGG